MATAKRFLDKAPNFVKRAYYSLVPFEDRYGKEYKKWNRFLNETLEWTPQQLKDYQFYQLRKKSCIDSHLKNLFHQKNELLHRLNTVEVVLQFLENYIY